MASCSGDKLDQVFQCKNTVLVKAGRNDVLMELNRVQSSSCNHRTVPRTCLGADRHPVLYKYFDSSGTRKNIPRECTNVRCSMLSICMPSDTKKESNCTLSSEYDGSLSASLYASLNAVPCTFLYSNSIILKTSRICTCEERNAGHF